MSAVRCSLCPKECLIPEGHAGDCRIRVNLGGKLVATTYGRPSAIHIDPIEKKPLYHFLPGTPIFSLATVGCNLHCLNCQNWQLSQTGPEDVEEVFRADPPQVVEMARARGCRSIAYTYSEPIVYYEYARDTSELARAAGLRNVLVTAGYIRREPLRRLCRVTDAVTLDVKAFDDAFYRAHCGGTLGPVLDALVTFREEGVWVEVSNLVIPTLTDDMAKIRALCRWLRDHLGEGTPLHFLRFHPQYRLRHLPPTPTSTLEQARRVALDEGLRHVYLGNLWGHPSEDTRCPADGEPLLRRSGTSLLENRLRDGACPRCGRPVPGRWT